MRRPCRQQRARQRKRQSEYGMLEFDHLEHGFDALHHF